MRKRRECLRRATIIKELENQRGRHPNIRLVSTIFTLGLNINNINLH